MQIATHRYHEIRSKYPDVMFIPLKLRLVKYVHDETTFVLGTTLFDNKYYQIDHFSDLYHGRWDIEELYKISKVLINKGVCNKGVGNKGVCNKGVSP